MLMLRPTLPFLATFVLACAPPDDPAPSLLDEPGEVDYRCPSCDWDPPLGNTHVVNGLPVAALDMDGDMYDGWQLISVMVAIDGPSADVEVFEVHAIDGILYGTDEADNVYAGDDFVRSVWTVYLAADDTETQMVVTDFIEAGDRSRYTFSTDLVEPIDVERYTCDFDPETSEYSAILFDDLDVDLDTGVHFGRPGTIYFGCLSGAVGKAGYWGYAPWGTSPDMHQAATRAIRADYCGDGTAYTVKGTPLQITDVLGINQFPNSSENDEAMWSPNGIECLLDPRLGSLEYGAIECGSGPLPMCEPGMGFGTFPNALLWTKGWTN